MKLLAVVCALCVVALAGAGRGINVGDEISSKLELQSGFPPKWINLSEYVSGRSVILMGLPGAFTPT